MIHSFRNFHFDNADNLMYECIIHLFKVLQLLASIRIQVCEGVGVHGHWCQSWPSDRAHILPNHRTLPKLAQWQSPYITEPSHATKVGPVTEPIYYRTIAPYQNWPSDRAHILPNHRTLPKLALWQSPYITAPSHPTKVGLLTKPSVLLFFCCRQSVFYWRRWPTGKLLLPFTF